MDPLLTEFAENRKFGRFLGRVPYVRSLLPSKTDLRGFKLAKTFFFMALTASVLSVLCNASIFKLRLDYSGPVNPDAAQRVTTPVDFSFGYLYELNAAFLYLFLAPTFVFLGVRFVRNVQFGLRGLTRRGFLYSNSLGSAAGIEETPLVVLGRMNRWLFRPAFLILILVATAVIVIGTEFSTLRVGGDYWKLAFGYVQSQAIPSYKSKTLQDLENSGRQINAINGLMGDKKDWTVNAVEGGSQTQAEKMLFWIFIVFALGIQVLFIPFAIWIFFKAIFVLRFVYKAISPNQIAPLAIKLDFEDQDKAFGLADFHLAYNYLVAMIFVGAAATGSVVLANVPKGSHRIIGNEGQAPLLAILGQGTTTFLPLILFFILAAFLFFLRIKTEEAREQHVEVLEEQIARATFSKSELVEKRKLASDQSSWPDGMFKTWFATALPSYIFPAFFLHNRPELARGIIGLWINVADGFHGMLRPIGNIINRIDVFLPRF